MFWLIIALTPYLLWSVVAVLDKYVVAHRVKNPSVFWVWQVYLAALLLLLIPFVGLTIPSPQILFWCFIAGFFYFFAALPYYSALQIEEMSRVNILWNLTPLFTLFGGYLFLHDRLSFVQLIAFFLLVAGGITASIHVGVGKLRLSRAFVLMLWSSVMYAAAWLALDYVTASIPFVHAYLFFILFAVLSSFFMFFSKKFRKDFIEHVHALDRKLAGTLLVVAFFDHLGIFFGVWAFSFGFASLFTAFEGFQSVSVFLIAIIISLYAPRIFKEELDRKNIILKLIAIVLMGVGVVFLSL